MRSWSHDPSTGGWEFNWGALGDQLKHTLPEVIMEVEGRSLEDHFPLSGIAGQLP